MCPSGIVLTCPSILCISCKLVARLKALSKVRSVQVYFLRVRMVQGSGHTELTAGGVYLHQEA